MRAALDRITERLAGAGIENARHEARMILEEFAPKLPLELLKPTPEMLSRAFEVVERRIRREPLQYILGKAWFFGREFEVGEGVLIPRQETELLVEAALEESFCSFLDWGTGSGCIAATLLWERECYGVAAEKNPMSIAIAWRNLKPFLSSRCLLWHSQSPFDIPAEGLDLVVSNPPYIRRGDIAGLMPEVRREPFIALDGGEDGLDYYRLLMRFAPERLHPGGRLIFEIGQGQEAFFYGEVFDKMELKYIRPDYAGIARVVCLVKKG